MGKADEFAATALREVGKSYSSHRDCSGLVAWAARQVGVQLPEGSEAQQTQGRKVPRSEWKAGDLCFWATPSGHVGIYTGDDKIVHAINPSQGIIVSDVDANMGGAFEECRRVIEEDGAPDPPKPRRKRKSRKENRPPRSERKRR